MNELTPEQLETLIAAVTEELRRAGLLAPPASQPASPPPDSQPAAQALHIDLPDPTTPAQRSRPGLHQPLDEDSLLALMNTTTARIGAGRSGPRPRTSSWLLFQSDQAITQDTLLRDVEENLLDELGLFRVQTRITGGKEEYLLRPDLGRQLSDSARSLIQQRCTPHPDVQICAGDGLSAQAIEANLRQMLPVLQDGCRTAGLSLGTPFFIQYCRVGVMNDIGDLLHPQVLILLIGERPGLGRAQSMSAYMAYHPQSGHSDAERDVISNIFDHGGTNPLEAGAYAVQLAQKMIHKQASGVQLKMSEGS